MRIIYPNGTVTKFDISLDIQSFNYCFLALTNTNSPIRVYPVKTNLLFVTYVVATDEKDTSTYIDWGMVIDLNGKILR